MTTSSRMSATILASWWTTLAIIFVVVPTFAQGYTTVTFELTNGATSYSKFLTRLRNAMAAPTRPCGLPSTRSTPLQGAEYIYVDLKISNTQWITIGLDTKSSYVWAYQDNVRYNGNYRASFFDDSPDEARSNLFRGSTIRTTKFGGSYNSLESDSGANIGRSRLQLGIQNLYGAIRSVYGRQEDQLNNRQEAKFVLIVIQMVSEAARFKVMEDAIVRNDNTMDVKRKLIAFQNDWGTISKEIHKAEAKIPKCSKFIPPLVISNVWYREEVNTVAEIKSDIGLLKWYILP